MQPILLCCVCKDACKDGYYKHFSEDTFMYTQRLGMEMGFVEYLPT